MPAYVWQAQVSHFARHYRVIAFDPRGQGESGIPATGYTPARRALDIKELIDQLGDKPVVLVGWSLGVLESLAYIRQHGDARVDAVVLVDNSIGEDPPPVFDQTFLPRLRRDQKATMRRFVRGMFRTPQSEQYLNRLTRSALRVPLDASLALLNYNHPRTYWKETVYATRKPVLYVVNNRFSGQARNLEKNRPGSRIAVFESAGHALFIDEPARFNRVLGEFITREVWTR
jgi:microsomal epoxide hydrolase